MPEAAWVPFDPDELSDDFQVDPDSPESQRRSVDPLSPRANLHAITKQPTSAKSSPGHANGDTHGRTAGIPPSDHGNADAHNKRRRDTYNDTLILALADALDDLERVRISTSNRIGALEREGWPALADGGRLLALSAAIGQLEKQCTRDLKWAVKQHPLGGWVARTIGIGEQQAGRLLAAIGDPYWNEAENRPRRGPAELWAYCGFHVLDGKRPRRQKGVKSNWSTVAKTRAYLCATSCIKQMNSPYRAVYDRERAKWAERDTTDMHKHNHALSVVAKEILKDLWIQARDLS